MWSVRRSRGLGYTQINQGMETRLKERLTGAAIIVALIVALVPEMFRGQANPPPASSTSSSGDGPPVRTYTIDLSNNPKSSGPLQAPSEAVPAPAASTAPTPPPAAPAVSASVTPAVPSTSTSPSVPAPKAIAAPPKPAQAAPPPPHASAVAPAASAPPHVTRTASAATSAPTPAPPKAATAAPAGTWSVQLGLFSKRENAERMVSEAKAKGVNTAITGPDAKGQFHVHVTGLTDRGAAQAMVQKLKGEGLPGAVVAP